MAWIESHTVLGRHRKVIELAKALRLKPAHLIGHLHLLWHSALEQQENGDLSKWSDDLILELSGLPPCEAPQWVRLLQEYGWLDDRRLHDWWEYAGKYLQSKYSHTPEKWQAVKRLHSTCKPSAPYLTLPNPPNLTKEKDPPISPPKTKLTPKTAQKHLPGFTEVIEHVHDTYLRKMGVKYPFNAEAGKVVKLFLGQLGPFQTMALWDLFLEGDWNWTEKATGKLVKVPHDLRQFQGKVTILLEDPRWKAKAAAYERVAQGEEKAPAVGLHQVPQKSGVNAGITKRDAIGDLKTAGFLK